MKATELRIGNFIYGYTENDEDEEVECLVKVVVLDYADITDYRIWVEGFSSKDASEYYGAFNPIPLTAEWLLKFGFRNTIKNRDSGYLQYGLQRMAFDFMVCIELDTEPDFYLQNKMILNLKYVHQLQNLYFALTGEELKASAENKASTNHSAEETT